MGSEKDLWFFRCKSGVYPVENCRELWWKGFKRTVGFVLLISFCSVFYLAFFNQSCLKNPSQCSPRLLPSYIGRKTIILNFSGELSSHNSGAPNPSPSPYPDPPVPYPNPNPNPDPPVLSPGIVTEKNIKTNFSHLLFGIGGSAKTWQKRQGYTELWWEPGKTRGFVWLDEKPEENEIWPKTLPKFKISGDTSKFPYTNAWGSRSAIRIARIVLESFALGLDGIRWFVMGDDDTVFFTENLAEVLGKYNHEEMYYIGGNSESVEQDIIHSYGMAFGGGGFAISYPLAAALVTILDRCIERYNFFYGSDERIRACMSEMGVPLTREPGFHQVDIRGEPYGLLAAHPVAPLVSLHHLDYVSSIFPGQTQLASLQTLIQASKTDPGRILQQTLCYEPELKWSVSVSWGYTVQIYPSIVLPNILEKPFQTFKTWRTYQSEPFTFNTRPIDADPCNKPAVFFLKEVGRNGSRRLSTTYKRYSSDPSKICKESGYPSFELQMVRVSSEKMEPGDWQKQAARRQCCDVVVSKDQRSTDIRIRKCSLLESIYPF
ncbi:hypothetical protein AMTRI_Chr08g161710 [Amborella trichopoda]